MARCNNFCVELGVELDEEPAEVEVKPILRSLQQVNISVVVEPPSSEDNSQARPARDEAEENRQVGPAASVEVEDEDEEEARETAAIARLGERVVEGAEEPVVERTNAGAAARGIAVHVFDYLSLLYYAILTERQHIYGDELKANPLHTVVVPTN